MPEKVTVEKLHADMESGFQAVRKDIKMIHQDLIKHDERTDKIIEMMQSLKVEI